MKGLSGVFSMGTANEVLYGKTPPRGPTLSLLRTVFDKTGTSFTYLLLTVPVCVVYVGYNIVTCETKEN